MPALPTELAVGAVAGMPSDEHLTRAERVPLRADLRGALDEMRHRASVAQVFDYVVATRPARLRELIGSLAGLVRAARPR